MNSVFYHLFQINAPNNRSIEEYVGMFLFLEALVVDRQWLVSILLFIIICCLSPNSKFMQIYVARTRNFFE